MSDIKPCAKCGSFAVQSMAIPSGGLYVHCFNEFSREDFDCDAPDGPKCHSSQESVDRWNAMQGMETAVATTWTCQHGGEHTRQIATTWCGCHRPESKE